jgi:hypothetical protein
MDEGLGEADFFDEVVTPHGVQVTSSASADS